MDLHKGRITVNFLYIHVKQAHLYTFWKKNPQSPGTSSVLYLGSEVAKICSKKLRVWIAILLVEALGQWNHSKVDITQDQHQWEFDSDHNKGMFPSQTLVKVRCTYKGNAPQSGHSFFLSNNISWITGSPW